MAVNFGVPFGPSGRPGFMVNSLYFFDDFIGSSLSATDDAATWDVINDSGSTAVLAEDEPNGVVTLTPNEIGLDSVIFLNGEPIDFNYAHDMIFEARLKVATIATNTLEVFIGLTADAPNFDLGSGTAGGIEKDLLGFYLEAGDIYAITGDGSTETREDTTSNLTADTYVTLTWKWHAKSQTVRYYVDGVRKITHSIADGDLLPTDGENLTIIIMAEQHAGTSTVDLDVDYVLYAADRA